jgi:hypothetical protein
MRMQSWDVLRRANSKNGIPSVWNRDLLALPRIDYNVDRTQPRISHLFLSSVIDVGIAKLRWLVVVFF